MNGANSTTAIPSRYHYLFKKKRSEILLPLETLRALGLSKDSQGTQKHKAFEPSRYLGTQTLKVHLNTQGTQDTLFINFVNFISLSDTTVSSNWVGLVV